MQGSKALRLGLQWAMTEPLKLSSCSDINLVSCAIATQLHSTILSAAQLQLQQVLTRGCHQPLSCALNFWQPEESRMQG